MRKVEQAGWAAVLRVAEAAATELLAIVENHKRPLGSGERMSYGSPHAEGDAMARCNYRLPPLFPDGVDDLPPHWYTLTLHFWGGQICIQDPSPERCAERFRELVAALVASVPWSADATGMRKQGALAGVA